MDYRLLKGCVLFVLMARRSVAPSVLVGVFDVVGVGNTTIMRSPINRMAVLNVIVVDDE